MARKDKTSSSKDGSSKDNTTADTPAEEIVTDAVAEIVEDGDTEVTIDAEIISEQDAKDAIEDALEFPEDDTDAAAMATDTPDAASEDGSNDSLIAPFGIIIAALVAVAVLVAILNRDNDAQVTSTLSDPAEESMQVASAPEIARPLEKDALGRPASTEDETATEQASLTATQPTDEISPATATATLDTPQNALLARAEKLQADLDEAGADNTSLAEITAPVTDELTNAPTLEDVTEIIGDVQPASGDVDEVVTQLSEAHTSGIAIAANNGTSGALDVTDALIAPATEQTQDAIEAISIDPVVKSASSIIAEMVDGPYTAETAAPITEAEATEATETVLNEEIAALETAAKNAVVEAVMPAPATIEETPLALETLQPRVSAAQLDDLKSDVTKDVLAGTEEAINQALAQTEEDVAELRQRMTEQTELQRESNDRLASLSSRLETITTDDLSQQRQSTFLLALSDLSEGIASGNSFTRQLETAENIAPNSRDLAMLRPYADKGLPTTTQLQRDYQVAARNALSSMKRDGAEGPVDHFFANLSGLFTVRKIGEVEGDSASAIIARAETRLDDNDLAAAVTELNQLNPIAREAFQDWIDAAQAKVDAARRIEKIERAISAG